MITTAKMEDYKSKVNVTFPGPLYVVVYTTTGPDAKKMFRSEVQVRFMGKSMYLYRGYPRLNKKSAEQSAAAGLLDTLANGGLQEEAQ